MATELHHDAQRLFQVDDRHHVFFGQGFEIQLVGDREIRRNGFRVVVDDDRFVAGFLDRPDRMHGRVVELDPLADTDRTGAQDDDFFAVARE